MIAEGGGSEHDKTLSWRYGFGFGNPNTIAAPLRADISSSGYISSSVIFFATSPRQVGAGQHPLLMLRTVSAPVSRTSGNGTNCRLLTRRFTAAPKGRTAKGCWFGYYPLKSCRSRRLSFSAEDDPKRTAGIRRRWRAVGFSYAEHMSVDVDQFPIYLSPLMLQPNVPLIDKMET